MLDNTFPLLFKPVEFLTHNPKRSNEGIEQIHVKKTKKYLFQ